MGEFARLRWRKVAAFLVGLVLGVGKFLSISWRVLKYGFAIVILLSALVGAINLYFGVRYNVAFRALDPASPTCRSDPESWSILADPAIDNNEYAAIDSGRLSKPPVDWEMRLRCSIQTHFAPHYQPLDLQGAPVGDERPLSYDLAFLEFQESGDPYLMCNEADYRAGACDGTTFEPNAGAPELHRGQLDALLERLQASPKNYVIAFVHGWRNTSDIGADNVANLRVYAAHGARFVADRCAWGDQRYCGMKTTAIYVGWRGARTDENRLARAFDRIGLKNAGASLASIAAIFTLFDRKPVSEAVAPSVIEALRAVASRIGVQGAYRNADLAPCDSAEATKGDHPICVAAKSDAAAPQGRMIIFGHSLGGNLLATGLSAAAVKLVERHAPGEFVPPLLGNLVVLLNPASEAAKWTQIQRAVWRRIVMSEGDEGRPEDYVAGHKFFRAEQRPILIAATAARDWPPDGVWATDCADFARMQSLPAQDSSTRDNLVAIEQEAKRRARLIDYDSATYDLFPAFRFDFRPLASSLERYAQRREAVPGAAKSDADYLFDGCAAHRPTSLLAWLAHGAGAMLRVFPFANTDIEQTHTIGQLDPPRSPVSIMSANGFSARPFGTTHSLAGWNNDAPADRRVQPLGDGLGDRELAIRYDEVVGRQARCPLSSGWLSKARAARSAKNGGGSAVLWDASDLPPESRPALRFAHGFYPAHLPPITRANDPFWNLRALDNALAEHDGYLLSSFICAMQQLVLDDITDIPVVPAPPQ